MTPVEVVFIIFAIFSVFYSASAIQRKSYVMDSGRGSPRMMPRPLTLTLHGNQNWGVASSGGVESSSPNLPGLGSGAVPWNLPAGLPSTT